MPLVAEIITTRQMKAILKTMKRLIICLVLVAGICFGGFAEENDSAENTYRFTNGGFWSCGQDFSGGFEFQYCKNCAFVIEFGGVNRFLTGDYKNTFTDFSRSSPALTIGFRTF